MGRVVEGGGREGAVARVAVRADVQREEGAAVDVEAVARVGLQVEARRRGAPPPLAPGGRRWTAPEREGVRAGRRLGLGGVDYAAAEGDGCNGGFAEGTGGVDVEPLEEAGGVVCVTAGVSGCGRVEGVEADGAVVAGRGGGSGRCGGRTCRPHVFGCVGHDAVESMVSVALKSKG